MEKENCVFCNLDKEKIIMETENTITILSNPYLTNGHCLVIPKEHYESPFKMPDEIYQEWMNEVRYVQKFLITRLGAQGADTRQNYRPFLEEGRLKRNHIHYHVIPRWLNDNLYSKCQVYEKNVFTDLNLELIEELMEKLK